MQRAAVIVLAAAVLLAGCESKKKLTAEFAHDDAVIAAPPIPTHYAMNTPDAKVELVLPQGIAGYPGLHAKLYEDGRQELIEFVTEAIEDRQRFAKKGVKQATPYERRLVWTITSISPHLISLREAWYDDTGGVHPDHGQGVLLWDRVHNVEVLQSELLKADADTSALDADICAKITAAKTARMGPTDPKSWTCPTWTDARAVLVPSATPYRVGGMMFLFDPHVIGAYAEGDYEVLVPLADFQPVLSPDWAPDFKGAPAPTVKTMP